MGEVRENPGKQCYPEHWDSGQQRIWESRMFCIPSVKPPSSSTPSMRPENSRGHAWDTALLLMPAPRPQKEPAPLLAPGQEQAPSKVCTGLASTFAHAEHSWEHGAGLRLICARKESPEGQAFASQCKYFHGVYVTTGTKGQPRCEQQRPQSSPSAP